MPECLNKIFIMKLETNFFPIKALNHTEDFDLIILGSSRANHHFNPFIIDSILGTKALNLGHDNCNIDYQSARLQEFIAMENGNYPKFVIWQVDMLSLLQTVGFGSRFTYPYYLFNTNFSDKLSSSKEFSSIPITPRFSFFIEFFRSKYYWKRLKEIPNVLYDVNKGYYPNNHVFDRKAFSFVDSIYFLYDDRTLRIFTYQLEDLVSHNVKVALVFSPLYHEAIAKIANKNEMYSSYQQIADTYNILIIDYFDSWISQDSSYFANATHLNKKGAELFTEELSNKLKAIGWHNNKEKNAF